MSRAFTSGAGVEGGRTDSDSDSSSFLREAAARIGHRDIAVPALMMLVVLTASNIVLLMNFPEKGELPSAAAILAIVARLGGLAFVGVALLRVMTNSTRRPWRLDAAFLVYLLASLVSLGLFSTLGSVLGASQEPSPVLIRGIISTVLLAPFAPWIVGMATAVPLGLNPRRFMRRFRLWLPPLLVWSLLIVSPLALGHALLDFRLIKGVGDLFWPLALLDGVLSLGIVLIGFALNATAYERAVDQRWPTGSC